MKIPEKTIISFEHHNKKHSSEIEWDASIEDMMYWDCAYLNCTKATVEEIIEHFKNG